jgi:hypothetical protein
MVDIRFNLRDQPKRHQVQIREFAGSPASHFIRVIKRPAEIKLGEHHKVDHVNLPDVDL